MKLIRRVEWGMVEIHWWNVLGLLVAVAGGVALYWLRQHFGELRLSLGSWLDLLFVLTLLLTLAGLSLFARWTRVKA